ncbi:hypothetical protein Tco_0622753 [Tanacetum coccineum]
MTLKHRNNVIELNTCKEQLLELKQEKLNFLTTQYQHTEILKENQTSRKELKELKDITGTWLTSYDEVNQSLGWHLKVIHVTWTQFGKKRTRFQLYTKIDIKRAYNAWRRRRDSLRRRQKAQATTLEIFETASEEADLKKPIEDSAGRRRRN